MSIRLPPNEFSSPSVCANISVTTTSVCTLSGDCTRMTGHQQLALAYPPADTLVRDYLLKSPNAADEQNCKAYLRSFLAALFTEARLSAGAIVPEGKMISYADMAHAFYDLFTESSRRSQFYNAVVTRRDRPADPWKALDELHELLKQRCSDWLPLAKCPILISMDEIHVLFDRRGKDTWPPHTLYSRLKSAREYLQDSV